MTKLRRILVVSLALFFALGAGGCYAKEYGLHYYWAEGLTVEETIPKYGPPDWTLDEDDGLDSLHLVYYTGFLNIVDLKVEEGIVVSVDIRPDD